MHLAGAHIKIDRVERPLPTKALGYIAEGEHLVR
jgi:hypothetical protein